MIMLTISATLGSAQTRSLSPVPRGPQTTGISCQHNKQKSDTVWHRPLGNQLALESHSCVALSSWLVR